jgi:thiol-disulfide isomerase/thioredoxin
LLDFWTYSCINCQRTIPYLNAWYAKYKDAGLEIIGVHTPEFDFEKKYENVAAAVRKFGIQYPVVMDSNNRTWNAYGNMYWPEHYLIDINGLVVDRHIGEGGYAETEAKIQQLLTERKDALNDSVAIPTGTVDITSTIQANSPETYFGATRNEYLTNGTSPHSIDADTEASGYAFIE